MKTKREVSAYEKTRSEIEACECKAVDGNEVKGEALARFIESRLPEDDTERASMVESLADAAGVTASTVNEVLAANLNCPPLVRLEGFAEALDVSIDDLLAAAEQDGCSYAMDDDEG